MSDIESKKRVVDTSSMNDYSRAESTASHMPCRQTIERLPSAEVEGAPRYRTSLVAKPDHQNHQLILDHRNRGPPCRPRCQSPDRQATRSANSTHEPVLHPMATGTPTGHKAAVSSQATTRTSAPARLVCHRQLSTKAQTLTSAVASYLAGRQMVPLPSWTPSSRALPL